MQAIILAGGKGTRLRPYTAHFPKPLMPIDDLPILEIVLRQLAWFDIRDVIITTGHLAEMIRLFCGNGSRWGLHIEYSNEDTPLGTAGPLALVADRLDDNFLVMNGDLLTTMDYRRLLLKHCSDGQLATVSLYPREVKVDFGVVVESPLGTLSEYKEKPVFHFKVSMGINALSKRVVQYMKAGERLDIPDLMARLMAAGQPVACHEQPCFWLDIGRSDDYAIANEEFAKRRLEFLPGGMPP
jgi:NDP-sugar pyrophosphorylase family protein